MDETIQSVLIDLIAKFPKVALGYLVASLLYQLFCIIASITTTDKDDKIADRLRIFFSLPKKEKSLEIIQK